MMCNFEGCQRPHSAKGYCQAHYAQLKAGTTLRPVAQRKTKDKGYRLEHACFTCGQTKHWKQFNLGAEKPECRDCYRARILPKEEKSDAMARFLSEVENKLASMGVR